LRSAARDTVAPAKSTDTQVKKAIRFKILSPDGTPARLQLTLVLASGAEMSCWRGDSNRQTLSLRVDLGL
jgi:hypothetical protein